MVGLREFGLCLAETRLRLTPPLLGGIVLGMPTQQAVVGRRTFVFVARIFAQGGESLGGRRWATSAAASSPKRVAISSRRARRAASRAA